MCQCQCHRRWGERAGRCKTLPPRRDIWGISPQAPAHPQQHRGRLTLPATAAQIPEGPGSRTRAEMSHGNATCGRETAGPLPGEKPSGHDHDSSHVQAPEQRGSPECTRPVQSSTFNIRQAGHASPSTASDGSGTPSPALQAAVAPARAQTPEPLSVTAS